MLFHPITLSILTILFSYVIICVLKKLGSNTKLNLPPSPPKIPILGNFHQITPKIHLFFHQMSLKYGSLVFFKFGGKSILAVSSAETATEILKTHDLIFADRFPPKAFKFLCGDDIGMSPYNEQWKQLRKFCVLELLSTKRVKSYKYVRQEEVDRMIEKISRSSRERGMVNLTETLFTSSNAIIFRCSLGDNFNTEYTDRFNNLIKRVNSLVESVNFGDFFPWLKWLDVVNGYDAKLRKIAQELDIFFDEIIEDRIHISSQVDNNDQGKEENTNFIDILIHAGKNNPSLTKKCVKGIILDMFVGGSDSSATVLDWAMAELMKNPKQMVKAKEEVRRVTGRKTKVEEDDIDQMSYLKCIVKETLRMHPPLPTLVTRNSTATAKIRGYDIPQDTGVFLNVWTIQRDPSLWDKPEEFRPERFIDSPIDFKGHDFKLIPFGSGRRGCPGISFGVAVVELVLANLLYAFDWDLPNGANSEELDMNDRFGITTTRSTPLHVVARPFCATFS